MAVISFASSKGGAGKTTTAIVLGTELAEGASVLMLDADPSARLLRWAGRGDLPARLSVETVADHRQLVRRVEAARREADYILIDLEGAATLTVSHAMSQSDLILVPTQEEQQEVEDALDTMGQIAIEESRGRALPAVITLNRVGTARSRLSRFLADQLAEQPLMKAKLSKLAAYSNLHNAGGGLRTLDPKDVSNVPKAIAEAEAFTNEVLDILEGKNTP